MDEADKINSAVYDNLILNHAGYPDRVRTITGFYLGSDVLAINKEDGMSVRCNINTISPSWNYTTHNFVLSLHDCDLGI